MPDYNHINIFLNKFKNILFKKDEIKSVFKQVVLKNILFELDDQDIIIKTPLIVVNGSPILKNEIFLKKEKILKELQERIPGCMIKDIR